MEQLLLLVGWLVSVLCYLTPKSFVWFQVIKNNYYYNNNFKLLKSNSFYIII